MPLFENSNSVEFGLKATIALILVGLALAALYFFTYNYPSLGWLCVGTFGVIVCAWLALANQGNQFVLGIGIACAVIILLSFAGGVLKDWRRLTEQKVQPVTQGQVIVPIYFVELF